MIRNTILGLTAAAALAVTALAPTTASAGYYGHGYKSYHAPVYSYGYKSHGYGYKSHSYGYKSYGHGYKSWGRGYRSYGY